MGGWETSNPAKVSLRERQATLKSEKKPCIFLSLRNCGTKADSQRDSNLFILLASHCQFLVKKFGLFTVTFRVFYQIYVGILDECILHG